PSPLAERGSGGEEIATERSFMAERDFFSNLLALLCHFISARATAPTLDTADIDQARPAAAPIAAERPATPDRPEGSRAAALFSLSLRCWRNAYAIIVSSV